MGSVVGCPPFLVVALSLPNDQFVGLDDGMFHLFHLQKGFRPSSTLCTVFLLCITPDGRN